MKKIEKTVFDQFLEITGGKKYPLISDDYQIIFEEYSLLKNMACIGPCFYLVGDMRTMQFLKVSEACEHVLGYSKEEINLAGANFTFQIVHPEDLQPCFKLIKTSWDFIKAQPSHLKMDYVSNFYFRAIKKDSSTIKTQLQVIILKIDENEDVLVTCNIITDISHLDLPDQVKLTIVNPENKTCLIATATDPALVEEPPLLSRRELEIIKLLTQGLNSRQIADLLCISYYTVRTHRKNILSKLGKKNTAEMVSYSLDNGLL